VSVDIDCEENYQSSDGLGHAFGLGHSINSNSIMYPFINDLNKKITLEDVCNVLNVF
jgi:hypothetical protein